MAKARITIHSSGPEGNIYHILMLVRNELQRQHRITEFNNLYENIQKGNYTEALQEIRKLVDLVDLDGCV